MVDVATGHTLVDRFELAEPLGQGGAGAVWRAYDRQRDADVAIKFLHDGDPDALRAEAEKLRRLSHPNIVRVVGAYDTESGPCIVFDYLPGGDARRLIGQPWSAIVTALLPATDALDYAHRAGLVHRDVRAANLLASASGRLCLADFGIAAARDEASAGGSLPGMSPQQLDGEPAAVADDVYAFGALLYELLAGAPLFHPDVTAERIRHEVPESLDTVANVPKSLARLVAAMLDKDPDRRPRGMAAVRLALDEVLAEAGPAAGDADEIRPTSRRASSKAAFTPRPLEAPAGGSNTLVYVAFGLLALAAIAVVFLLPTLVAEREPEATQAVVEQPVEEPSRPAEDQAGRELADTALADLLAVTDPLKEQAVERWGGGAWFKVVDRVTEGDEAYKARDFDAAIAAYRDARELAVPLGERVGDVLAGAIEDGRVALEDGNQRLALERFDLALAIDDDSEAAQRGKARALQLDKVLRLTGEGSDLEVAADWQASLEAYDAALAVDPAWRPAREGRDRVAAIVAENRYQTAMSKGYDALGRAAYSDARAAFERALGVRPGDADANRALAQIATEQRLASINQLRREAEAYRAEENWRGAIERYQSILAKDASLVEVREALSEVQQRAELDVRMREAIGAPDRLADESVLQATRRLLDYARGVTPRGPALARQLEALEGLVTRAAQPVTVELRSDNQTEVVIYKVGRFAPFTSREIELRPGVYTALGVRSGYRDVRLEFRVQPETAMQPVVIRCEDPI